MTQIRVLGEILDILGPPSPLRPPPAAGENACYTL